MEEKTKQKINYEEAYALFKTGESLEEIARTYGTFPSYIKKVFQSRGYMPYEKEKDPSRKEKQKPPKDIKDQIVYLIRAHPGLNHQQIADRLKFSRQMIVPFVTELVKDGQLTKDDKKRVFKGTPIKTKTINKPIETLICDTCPDYQIVTLELLLRSGDDPEYIINEIKDILQKHEDVRFVSSRPASDEFVMIARFKNGK